MNPPAKCHALVIEDSEEYANQLANVLGRAGLRTTIAFDGVTGLESQDRDPADFVLLDLRLPDMDGSDVALDLHSRYPDVPIIVVTGDPTRLNLGFSVAEVLQKPVRTTELRRLAARYCAKGRLTAPGKPELAK